jgi:hypothetical protein
VSRGLFDRMAMQDHKIDQIIRILVAMCTKQTISAADIPGVDVVLAQTLAPRSPSQSLQSAPSPSSAMGNLALSDNQSVTSSRSHAPSEQSGKFICIEKMYINGRRFILSATYDSQHAGKNYQFPHCTPPGCPEQKPQPWSQPWKECERRPLDREGVESIH